jgi:GT2 family glycosyltransferase
MTESAENSVTLNITAVSNPKIVGIVTVLFNSDDFLPGFFESLRRQTGVLYRLYIIDNSKTDSGCRLCSELVEKYGIVANIVFNNANVGVAAGNNQGILQALRDGCEWVLLLNNDTTFPPDFLRQLVSSCDQMGWQVVVPKIHFDTPKGHIWFGGGGFNHLRGYTGFHVGMGEKDIGQFDEPSTVAYSPTCAMLVSSQVFRKVGLMDEAYFVYFDDTDFCWRLGKSEILIGYWPKAFLVHKVGGSTGGLLSPFTVHITSRNRLYYLRKHFGLVCAFLWTPVFLLYYAIQFVKNRNIECLKAGVIGSFEYHRMRPCERQVPIEF